MERWEGKVAVITGASVGMGKLLCEELVKAGMIVIGLGRDTKKIQVFSIIYYIFKYK